VVQSFSCEGDEEEEKEEEQMDSIARLKPGGTRAETDFVFRRNGRVHLNRRGSQFSQLLAAELCASALVMLDTPRSEVV